MPTSVFDSVLHSCQGILQREKRWEWVWGGKLTAGLVVLIYVFNAQYSFLGISNKTLIKYCSCPDGNQAKDDKLCK